MSVNVVMLGPPGAGKGTQAERIARGHGIPRISTGDILREATQAGTELGEVVRSIMESGQLVGDDLMIEIVRERLERPDAAKGFVLDGFPRTVVQAQALDRLVSGRGPLVVLHMVVPVEVLVARLSSRRICRSCGFNAPPQAAPGAPCPKCGGTFVTRRDDDEGIVRERLKVYEQQTQPLVEFYRARPTFVAVDGNRAPDEVFGALDTALANLAASGAVTRQE